ncbi:TIGR02647 family protein [Spongiibacter taiwanensis]|uniref:TIGR02647 family protein n=1 Tax=Spongiibacter taiwanensis TaxID=1748242 RepID=UPI0020356DC2|nr:TIGR02647 family protein [Spongiibacter taiwanensis]USA43956.1 TIGR02647 family protein [Spongiibacter taiwanensis]
MRLQNDMLEELRLLAQFNPASTLEGIKVHHTAEESLIEAAERLFAKGLVSQPDGGYLTLRGQEAVQHLDNVLSLLNSAIAHH